MEAGVAVDIHASTLVGVRRRANSDVNLLENPSRVLASFAPNLGTRGDDCIRSEYVTGASIHPVTIVGLHQDIQHYAIDVLPFGGYRSRWGDNNRTYTGAIATPHLSCQVTESDFVGRGAGEYQERPSIGGRFRPN
jgi:hypothetical protein